TQQQRQIDVGTDRDEKEAEKQAFERLDIAFELMAELAFRKHHAAQKRAERGRQSYRAGEKGGGPDKEQRGSSENLPQPRARDEAEPRAQDPSSREDNGGDGTRHRDRLHPIGKTGQQAHCLAGAFGGGEQGEKGQDRNDGQILQQKDRKRDLAGVG